MDFAYFNNFSYEFIIKRQIKNKIKERLTFKIE